MTLPYWMSCKTALATASMGMAKPTPADVPCSSDAYSQAASGCGDRVSSAGPEARGVLTVFVKMAVFTPTTLPLESSRGPPLLPAKTRHFDRRRNGSYSVGPASRGELQTWVDGSIGLDAPADEHAGPALDLPADAADDACRQGVVKPKGVANAQDLWRSRSSANLLPTQASKGCGQRRSGCIFGY